MCSWEIALWLVYNYLCTNIFVSVNRYMINKYVNWNHGLNLIVFRYFAFEDYVIFSLIVFSSCEFCFVWSIYSTSWWHYSVPWLWSRVFQIAWNLTKSSFYDANLFQSWKQHSVNSKHWLLKIKIYMTSVYKENGFPNWEMRVVPQPGKVLPHQFFLSPLTKG